MPQHTHKIKGHWFGLLWLSLLTSCRQAPAWLSQAPLIGYRFTDDRGQQGYLPQPPRRIAVLSPAALGLWKTANLPTITLIGCTGLNDAYQNFYLPCDDPPTLIEVLYKAKVEWIWADPSYPWPEAPKPPAPVYHFHPKGVSDWLTRLSLLGDIYDAPALRQVTDSLHKTIDTLIQRLSQERPFRVLLLGFSDSLILYSQAHPLGQMVTQAGGIPPTAQTAFLSPKTLKDSAFLPDIVIVPAEKPEILNTLLLEVPELYSSRAILHKRVFSMPRTLMEMPYYDPLNSFYTLVRILHPEVVGSETTPTPEAPKHPEE